MNYTSKMNADEGEEDLCNRQDFKKRKPNDSTPRAHAMKKSAQTKGSKLVKTPEPSMKRCRYTIAVPLSLSSSDEDTPLRPGESPRILTEKEHLERIARRATKKHVREKLKWEGTGEDHNHDCAIFVFKFRFLCLK